MHRNVDRPVKVRRAKPQVESFQASTPVNDAVRECVNQCSDDSNPMRSALLFVQQLVEFNKLNQEQAREVFDRSIHAMQAMTSVDEVQIDPWVLAAVPA